MTKAKKPRKQSPRKSPDEWRAINRSAKVKDGRSVLLAVPDPRKPGELLVIEAYWDVKTKAWWAANCAAGLPGCDPIADVYGAPTMWRPMPEPPMQHEAVKPRSTRAKKAQKIKVPAAIAAAARTAGTGSSMMRM
jgi:hypothetical protein